MGGYVSTGHLPAAERVQALVTAAFEQFRGGSDGSNSTVYPALARVPSQLFGICVTETGG